MKNLAGHSVRGQRPSSRPKRRTQVDGVVWGLRSDALDRVDVCLNFASAGDFASTPALGAYHTDL
jgi:hypothetical protein